jgi:hypothetical protein
VEPARRRAKKGEPPQEDDARLSAGTDDRGDTADGRPKALAEETRQQALDKAMLKVELHNNLRFGLTLSDVRRLKDETAHKRFTPPTRPVSRICRPARPQLVEQRGPARVLGEARRFGIEQHGFRHTETPGLQRGTVVLQGDLNDMANILPSIPTRRLAVSSARWRRSCSSFNRARRLSASSPSSRSATFTSPDFASEMLSASRSASLRRMPSWASVFSICMRSTSPEAPSCFRITSVLRTSASRTRSSSRWS